MGEGRVGLRPEYIRQAVDASLQRWQTDSIDLYQSHDDAASVPLADTLGAFADLIAAGKVRAIGASNHSAPRLAEALRTSAELGLPRYESLQPLYNLYDRAVLERDLARSEEHTSELQSPCNLVCRLLLEKKKNTLLMTSHTQY